MKADTDKLAPEKRLANDRYTPESSRSGNMTLKGRY
jgi:hypothetical protein